MSDEYMPSAPELEYIREVYAKAESAKYGHAVCDTEYKEFDAMMAARDKALREQIARDIEQLGVRSAGRNLEGNSAATPEQIARSRGIQWFSEVAARIAREEGE